MITNFDVAATNLSAMLNVIESEYVTLPVSVMAGVIRALFAEMRAALQASSQSSELLEKEARELRFWFSRPRTDPSLQAYIAQLEHEVLWGHSSA